MLIAINRRITRHRRRLVILLGAVALALALMLAHSAVGGGHMRVGDGGGMPMESALAVCLAVTQTAAVGLAAMALTRSLRFTRTALRAPSLMAVLLPNLARPVAVGARAGPERLQVFRL